MSFMECFMWALALQLFFYGLGEIQVRGSARWGYEQFGLVGMFNRTLFGSILIAGVMYFSVLLVVLGTIVICGLTTFFRLYFGKEYVENVWENRHEAAAMRK